MLTKKRLLAASPFLVLPVLVVSMLPSCEKGDRSDPPPEPVATVQQAVDGGSGCKELDEMIPTPQRWKNLATDYAGLIANGNDITAALEQAFDDLSNNSAPGSTTNLRPVLYIPPPPAPYTYWTIDHTVTLWRAYYPTIVGDDPTTTVIRWAGATFDPTVDNQQDVDMIHMVDAAGVKLGRITLDGAGVARIGVQMLQSSCATPCSGGCVPAPGGGPAGNCTEGSGDAGACDQGDGGGTLCCEGYVRACDAVKAVGQSWPMYFSEFHDDVFKNMSFGVAAAWTTTVEGFENPNQSGSAQVNLAPPFPLSTANIGSGVIRRSRFQDISLPPVTQNGEVKQLDGQAFLLDDFNTLDWLIEDSEFTHSGATPNGVGLRVALGSSVIVLNNRFAKNDVDMLLASGFNSVRGNASSGSNEFLRATGQPVEITGNHISTVGPKRAIHDESANVTLLDNFIQTPPGVAAVEYDGWFTGIAHGGNWFSGPYTAQGTNWLTGTPATIKWINPDPQLRPSHGDNLHLVQVGLNNCDDATANPCDTFNAVAPSAGSAAAIASVSAGATFAPKSTRTVALAPSSCLCPAGVSPPPQSCTAASTCAATINQWLQTAPQGSALHFPAGDYYLNTTLEIPAGLDVTLFGDGVATHLYWADTVPGGVAGGEPYMIHMAAPAVASVRDMWLLASYSPEHTTRPGGILVDSTDDQSGIVYVDTGACDHCKSGIDVVGLDNVLVWAEQFGAAYNAERELAVIGGGRGSQGSAETRGLVSYAGGGASLGGYAVLKNWGKAVVIGSDNEGRTEGAVLDQSGYLTMAGGRTVTAVPQVPYAWSYAKQPNHVVESTFRGRATFMHLDDSAGILSTGARQAEVLSLGNWYTPNEATTADQPSWVPCQPYDPDGGPPPPNACDFTQPNATQLAANKQMSLFDRVICGAMQNYACVDKGSASQQGAFVNTMLGDLRKTPNTRPSTCGQTDVRIHRVFFEGGTLGDPSLFMRTAIRVQRI